MDGGRLKLFADFPVRVSYFGVVEVSQCLTPSTRRPNLSIERTSSGKTSLAYGRRSCRTLDNFTCIARVPPFENRAAGERPCSVSPHVLRRAWLERAWQV